MDGWVGGGGGWRGVKGGWDYWCGARGDKRGTGVPEPPHITPPRPPRDASEVSPPPHASGSSYGARRRRSPACPPAAPPCSPPPPSPRLPRSRLAAGHLRAKGGRRADRQCVDVRNHDDGPLVGDEGAKALLRERACQRKRGRAKREGAGTGGQARNEGAASSAQTPAPLP